MQEEEHEREKRRGDPGGRRRRRRRRVRRRREHIYVGPIWIMIFLIGEKLLWQSGAQRNCLSVKSSGVGRSYEKNKKKMNQSVWKKSALHATNRSLSS